MKKLLILAVVALLGSAMSYGQDTTKWKTKQSGAAHNTMQPKGYVTMKGDRMLVYKNGQQTELKENLTLANGTVIMTDGTVLTKSGKTVKLSNGQWLDKNGMLLSAGTTSDADPTTATPTPAVPPKSTDPVPVPANPNPEEAKPVTPPQNSTNTTNPVNTPTPEPPVKTPPRK
jgi:hypothetical protein